MNRIALAMLLLVSFAVPAHAGFDEGLAASKRGDYATALREWRPLAEQGSAKAQFSLGAMYYFGDGVAQDYAEAVKWYRRAAEQGSAKAQSNLGVMYENGEGVAQDGVEAARWYRKAAEQGEVGAQNNLAVMYYFGQGIPRDLSEAMKWYRKAAEQGDDVAQYNVGFMYERGEGVAQDDVEAARWYRKAAEQGFAKAQISLGAFYVLGQGVVQDLVQAHMWAILASGLSTGNDRERAIKLLGITTSSITPTQVAEAERLAREWTEKRASTLGLAATSTAASPPSAKVEAKPCPILTASELADVANWVGMGFSDDAIGDMYLSITECAKEWRKAVER